MYLTFDVGTTSVKTALYSREGNKIYKVIKNYGLNSPHVEWYEVEPETYWSAVYEGFREILAKSGIAPADIKSISGCSQGETIIFLDSDGSSVRPAIVWYDNRARKEADELKVIMETGEFYKVTGMLEMNPMWSAPKILWVKNNERAYLIEQIRSCLSRITSHTG